MREYKVSLPSGRTTRMRLSDDDAQRLDAKPVETKQAAKPANKSRTAGEK